jgi:hypothetical protein
MKKLLHIVALALLGTLVLVSTAAAVRNPRSPATFTLVQGLPATMQVGQSYTVTVEVTATERFKLAMALPDDQFPGKGVVARGGDRAGAGTSATLDITFTAKSSTAALPGGKDQVAVVAGVRYPGGQTVSQRFDFSVTVP